MLFYYSIFVFVSSGVSEACIYSVFGGRSSKTGSGSDSRTLASQPSVRDFARYNWPIHVPHGNGGSANTFTQNTGSPNNTGYQIVY